MFDKNTLLVAKVAFCLKESLGTRTSVLSKLMDAFLASGEKLKSENPKYVVFKCQIAACVSSTAAIRRCLAGTYLTSHGEQGQAAPYFLNHSCNRFQPS